MNVNATSLLQAIETLNLVPARAGVRSSEVVRLQGTKKQITLMLASEIKGTFTVPVTDGESFDVYLDRSKLFGFLNLAKGSKDTATFGVDLVFDPEGKTPKGLSFKFGRRKAVYTGSDTVSGYAKTLVGKDEKEIKLDAGMVGLIILASKYTTTDFTRPELNGVHLLKKQKLIASSRIGAINFAAEAPVSESTPIPEEFSTMLSGAEQIMISKQGCRLAFGNGSLFRSYNDDQFSGKIASLAKLIPKFQEAPKVLSAPAAALLDALARLKACSGEDVDYPVVISGAAGADRVDLELSGDGWQFKETVKNCTLGKKGAACDLPLFHLIPLLEQATSEKNCQVDFHYKDGEGAGYIYFPKQAYHMIMCRTKVEAPGK